MGTIVEILKIIDRLTKKKIQGGNNQENKKFRETLRKEMKKLNKDQINTKV